MGEWISMCVAGSGGHRNKAPHTGGLQTAETSALTGGGKSKIKVVQQDWFSRGSERESLLGPLELLLGAGSPWLARTSSDFCFRCLMDPSSLHVRVQISLFL